MSIVKDHSRPREPGEREGPNESVGLAKLWYLGAVEAPAMDSPIAPARTEPRSNAIADRVRDPNPEGRSGRTA
jgi:hypothetical protein